MPNDEMTTATACHPMLSRWWLRTRHIAPVLHADGQWGASQELYVPFWAWPLELAHRALFGRAILVE